MNSILSAIGMGLSNTVANLKLAAGKLLPRFEDTEDEKAALYSSVLYHNCYILQRLCGNIGAVSGSQSFSADDFTIFDLDELCRDCADSAAHLTHIRGLDICVEGERHFVKFYGRDRYIERMVLNLLSNSIKHTPDGGSITISLAEKEQYIDLTVTDNGSGIAPENMSDIFCRYKRESFVPSPEGVGFGLTVTQKIARLHGGMVIIESEPDRGTRVTVKLRRREPRETLLRQSVSEYKTSGMNPVLMELSDALSAECFTEKYMD